MVALLVDGAGRLWSDDGIIGLGRIGEALAKRAKAFDMRVLYNSRSRKREAEGRIGVEFADMDSLLKESDFVCVMTPYWPETRNLIGERELALMKRPAILINTARGGIVNEEALHGALMFEEEPVKPDHPLLSLSNVVALPHIGSASIRIRTVMAELAAANLRQALTGEIPAHLVNKEVVGRM